MPLPSPRKSESRQDFLDRCIPAVADEFDTTAQRVAVCSSQWRKAHPSAKSASTNNDLRTRTQLVKLEADKSLLRTETMDGREYLVAPVVCLVAGVHNSEYISYEEITVFPEAWAGAVLPIDHPQDENGIAITANSPKVIESSVVGFLFNVEARKDLQGIAGEIWVDVEKAATVPGGEEVLRKLNAGEGLEVSTAYFTFTDNVAGEWMNPNGTIEKFTGSQFGIRPDHLALLPFDLGACSWEDGCGAPRVNTSDDHTLSSVKDIVTMPDTKTITQDSNLLMFYAKKDDPTFKDLKVNGKQLGRALKGMLAAHAGEDGTSSGMIDRLATACGIDKSKVVALVNGELDFAPRSWLAIFSAVLDVDPYDLFMAASNDNSDVRYSTNELQGHENVNTKDSAPLTIPDNKNLNSSMETVVADKVTPEKPASCGCTKATVSMKIKEIVTNALKSFGIEEGTELEKVMNKKEKVDALIASDKTQFSENHREWLTSLSEDQLTVLEPKVETKVETKAEVKPEVKAETKAEVKAEPEVKAAATVVNAATVTEVKAEVKAETPAITKEQILAALGVSVESIEAIKTDAEAKKTARTNKVKAIAAIEGCVYTEAELATFSDAMLDRTMQALEPETPFRFNGSVQHTAANREEIPATPNFLLNSKGFVRGTDYATPAKGGR